MKKITNITANSVCKSILKNSNPEDIKKHITKKWIEVIKHIEK